MSVEAIVGTVLTILMMVAGTTVWCGGIVWFLSKWLAEFRRLVVTFDAFCAEMKLLNIAVKVELAKLEAIVQRHENEIEFLKQTRKTQ